MYHVLVIEDELLIRDAIVEMVHQLGGFKVTGEAASCEEGWRLMQELWPSVVITDIQLPDKDGLELIHRIRNQRLPVVTIIISGHDRFSYAQNAIRLHVSEYLLKPISEGELHAALSRSVSRLETFMEPNQMLLDIQLFIDRLHEFDPLGLFERTDRILRAILNGRSLDQGAKVSYLRIFLGKLTEYIKVIHPAFQDIQVPEDLNEQRVRHVFHDLLNEWTHRYPQFASNNMRLVIKRACEYIGSHMQDELTLRQMADYSNVSSSYFGVLFKQYTGKSFVNYLNYVRIEKAMEYLRTSDKKVYEIAQDVGFATLPYFNRVFKNVASLTPNEYRKGFGL